MVLDFMIKREVLVNRLLYIIHFANMIFWWEVCYVPNDTPIAQGTNNAVIFLMSTTGFVLLSIIASIFYFYNKANKINHGEN